MKSGNKHLETNRKPWPPTGLKTYYHDDYCVIVNGDCREVLPHLKPDVILTDPLWPLDRHLVAGNGQAEQLLGEALRASRPGRLVLTLGQKTDPRILRVVPDRLPFLTVLWLRYVRKLMRAGVMHEADVGYVFGSPSRSVAVHASTEEVAWGTRQNGREGRCRHHPCPRHPDHARWLVGNWTNDDELVVDPFAGTGAFIVACKNAGRRCIGIEIEEKYCEVTVRKLQQEVLPL